MPKSDIQIIRVEPGHRAYYTLDELVRHQKRKKADPSEWGICGVENIFWLGKRVIQGGKDILHLPLTDILEKRDELHPDWGDEEVYVFAGIDQESGKFTWSLLNEERARLVFDEEAVRGTTCLN
jgi:hypothetical protein